MKATIALAVTVLSLAPAAFAGTSNYAHIEPDQYSYDTNLDVAKVISLTDVINELGVAPVTMVYKDSKGDVHKVQFLQLGGQNSSD
ncbi:DUF2790 domain-containing protein [Pseudomonas sp.]|uniref:DUF2790 domain-containing protein n=1 Tax=Pseudomonas sp. TaxID=306 RepID=UPI003A971863